MVTEVFDENNIIRSDLEKLVADVEDVTEPSSIDKVLELAQQIQEEDDNFIELLTQKLHNVDIYWEQPWYQREKRLSRAPKYTSENETTTYRTDAISKEEHEIIAKNWRKFRKKYQVPDKLICLARWKNLTKSKNPNQCAEEKARRFATAYLTRGLQRNNYQVFQHILTYYGGYRKGFYSPAEEKIIEICHHHKPKMIGTVLSLVLGREPRRIYKRLEFMVNGKPEKKRIKWDLPTASKFLQLILKYTDSSLEELKNKKIDTSVWRMVGEDMDQNDLYLQHFWYTYLHSQLFVRCDIKLNRLKKSLCKKLRAKATDGSYKVWSDIRWKNVALDFPDGFTPRFLYKICNTMIRSFKGYIRAPLEDVVDYGLQKLKKQKRKKRNKRLKTLTYKDGQLEVVDYRS